MSRRPFKLETCPRCRVEYPSDLLAPFFPPPPGLPAQRVCGICALELTNEVHGTERTEFHGQQSEWMRLDAIAWRRRQEVMKA